MRSERNVCGTLDYLSIDRLCLSEDSSMKERTILDFGLFILNVCFILLVYNDFIKFSSSKVKFYKESHSKTYPHREVPQNFLTHVNYTNLSFKIPNVSKRIHLKLYDFLFE